MLSNKPYLMRAFYDWIVDNGWTPVIMANAQAHRCQVPPEFIEHGEVVLNISPTAVRDLKINQEFVQFKASFSGVIYFLSMPVQAVIALYADEDNSQGIFFDLDQDSIDFPITTHGDEMPSLLPTSDDMVQPVKQKPHLRVIE